MKVLILDDHEAIRIVIKQQVLDIIPTAKIFEYSTVDEALYHFSQRVPVDFVISDLELKQGCNLSIMETARNHQIPVMIFSSHVNKVLLEKLESKKVKCSVSKTSGIEALKLGIRALLHGKSYYCPLVVETKKSSGRYKETEPLKLTNAQIKVLKVIDQGYKRKEAASILKLSATTIDNQIAKARDINDCDSQDELMRRFRFWET